MKNQEELSREAEDAVVVESQVNPAPTPEEIAEAQLQQQHAQAQQMVVRHVQAVIFNYVRSDGSNGTDRVFIQDVPPIRYRAQIEHYERLIQEQSQGTLIKVMITNFFSLEG